MYSTFPVNSYASLFFYKFIYIYIYDYIDYILPHYPLLFQTNPFSLPTIFLVIFMSTHAVCDTQILLRCLHEHK